MLVLGLTLLLFSIILYNKYSQKLYGDLDDVLESKAESIVDSINTYWEAERREASQDGLAIERLTKIDNINFAKIAQRWVEERSSDPKLLGTIVQIFNVRGIHIASSKNIPKFEILPKDIFDYVSHGNRHFETMAVAIPASKSITLRILSIPVTEDEKIAYIVQVARPLSSIHSAMAGLKIMLAVLLPFTILLTGVIGTFFAKIALSPVDKIIKDIHQITAENLKKRISIPDTKDEIGRLASTFNDMLVRLEYAFSSQRRFIEDLAHELKTPLAILKGEIEVTLKKIRSKEEYEDVLNSSKEEVDKINSIIENLLIFARFENDAVMLEFKTLNITTLLKGAVNDIEIMAMQKNIDMPISAQEDIFISGDEDKLKRLFLNILDNAIKYTPQGGKVVISVTKENNFVRIKVSDTGSGIPEKEISHIFDRFYQVDKSCYKGGFGLGLSIARSIVEAHNGKIEAESVLNRGTVFIISLPSEIG